MRLFIETVQRGSFALVARDRNVDPSSVSRAIRALEDELGLRLFQRTTRRMALTEAGTQYFERVKPLVEEIYRAHLEVIDLIEAPTGNLRVTASVSLGHQCLVPLLPGLQEQYPSLSIELALTDANIDLVAEQIDVAVRLGPRTDSGLIGTKLMRTHYRVCASPDYLARYGFLDSPTALSERQCLLFPLRGYRKQWRFRSSTGEILEVPVKGNIIISNALSLHRAALDGLGPVLLANWLVDQDITDGSLIRLFPDYEVTATDFDTAAWILYPSRSYVPLKVRVFIDFLKMSISSPRLARPGLQTSERQ